MRIVDVQHGLLQARGERQFAQRRDVAVHAEDAVGRDHRRAVGRATQLPHRALGIGMRVTAQAAAGQACGIDQAGVVEAVLHADVVLAQQGLQDREVGEIAAAEDQRARIAEPAREFLFQRFVRGVMAGDQVRGGTAGAFARGGVLQRVDDGELLRQAEVVVAAEIQQPAAVEFAAHAVAARDRAAHARATQGFALLARGFDAVVQVGAGHRQAAQERGEATLSSTIPACTVPAVSTTGIGRNPSRANSARSRSVSGLPVVSSFSP
jgi:hypothetical protein